MPAPSKWHQSSKWLMPAPSKWLPTERSDPSYLWVLQQKPLTWSGTSVIRRSSVPPRAWVGRQPTGRNQTQLRSKRLQYHDDLWLQNPTTPDDGNSNHQETGIRHAHPHYAQQPLMLVNSQKSGHLGQGCSKDWTHRFCLTPQTTKTSILQQPHSNWVGEMLHIHLVCMPPSLGPKATFPGTTRQGDQIREPATPTRDAYQRPKSLSTTVCHTATTPRSGH